MPARPALSEPRAAGLEPADAFDDLLLGRERFLKGDWDTARSHFDAALSRRPDLFWARCLLAIAELNSTPPRPAEAKTELTTCLLAQPSSAWLYLLRGSAYGQMGVTLGVAARASGRGSRLAAEAEARFKDAEADFRKAHELGLDQSLGYVLLMNRGVMRFQRGCLPEAAADFEKAIALDKGRYNAYASLAQVLRKLGRKAEAVERLDKAIALEPRLAALYRGRPLARLDGAAPTPGEAEASLRDLETSGRLEPAGSRAAADDHARRGRLLLRLDRAADALAAADTALALVRDLGRAHLVRVAALLALERYADVLGSCDAALAAGHPSAELFRLRGLARFGLNDFAGAIDDYTQALALPGDDRVETYRDRGLSHLFSNASELALRDFDAALRLDPGDPDGYAGRGTARVRLGDLRGAVADAEESVRREGRSARLLYIAAETLSLASARARRRGPPQPGRVRRLPRLRGPCRRPARAPPWGRRPPTESPFSGVTSSHATRRSDPFSRTQRSSAGSNRATDQSPEPAARPQGPAGARPLSNSRCESGPPHARTVTLMRGRPR